MSTTSDTSSERLVAFSIEVQELQTELTDKQFVAVIDAAKRLIESATLEARYKESEAAWLNSVDLPNANAITRSLAGRKRHLEAELQALKGDK